MFKLFVKTIIFFVLFLSISSTSYSKDPLQFIKEVTGDASSILKNDISKEQKIEKLKNLAEESVDIKGVGLYSLGKYRKLISKEKLNEYEVLFKKYFLKSFSSRLSEYSDPKINVVSKTVLNEKKRAFQEAHRKAQIIDNSSEKDPYLKEIIHHITKNNSLSSIIVGIQKEIERKFIGWG